MDSMFMLTSTQPTGKNAIINLTQIERIIKPEGSTTYECYTVGIGLPLTIDEQTFTKIFHWFQNESAYILIKKDLRADQEIYVRVSPREITKIVPRVNAKGSRIALSDGDSILTKTSVEELYKELTIDW